MPFSQPLLDLILDTYATVRVIKLEDCHHKSLYYENLPHDLRSTAAASVGFRLAWIWTILQRIPYAPPRKSCGRSEQPDV